MGPRISNDVAVGTDMYSPMVTALGAYKTYYNDYCPGTGFTGDWKCMGPFTDYYGTVGSRVESQGRVNAIYVHHTDTAQIWSKLF